MKKQRDSVLDTLLWHGVDDEFAKKVAETYANNGADAALIQLYAGGWEVNTYHVQGEKHLSIDRVMKN